MSHNLEHQKVHTRMVKEVLKAVARANNHPYQSVFRGLTLSGTKTHVKQRFLPLTPLLMVSDDLWSPVLPA
ncbi:hypothetical protein EWQ94_17800 [Salmonella enterica]|nr:hypothetical protein [Salmonella enterica]